MRVEQNSAASQLAHRSRQRRPGRPTREQSEQRDRELLDTALDLFLEHGFEGTTIEMIVDAVGMARRTVYVRYRDKITLFKASLQPAIDEWVVPAERLRAAETEDLEQTLLAVARLMIDRVRTPSGMRLARIANAEVFRMPELGAYLWTHTAEVALIYLEDLFRRHLSPGNTRDTALAFLLLVVEGAFQTIAWQNTTAAESDRQIAFRTHLFLFGVACAAQPV